jgi:hypothetical protein
MPRPCSSSLIWSSRYHLEMAPSGAFCPPFARFPSVRSLAVLCLSNHPEVCESSLLQVLDLALYACCCSLSQWCHHFTVACIINMTIDCMSAGCLHLSSSWPSVYLTTVTNAGCSLLNVSMPVPTFTLSYRVAGCQVVNDRSLPYFVVK